MYTIRQAIGQRTDKIQKEIDRLQVELARIHDTVTRIPREVLDVETEHEISVDVYPHTCDLTIRARLSAIGPFFEAMDSPLGICGGLLDEPDTGRHGTFSVARFYLYEENRDGMYPASVQVIHREEQEDEE